ncbi:hypothetical protein EV191_102514 [Tamaricihabitans halophyticus]|uniref:SalK n=1 Tax=Tamaricihabitans halophyticus TaxID=1262583 RepID=A0A4R2QYG6_9PSEU|nr:hypothetical protein [Tamaricihabitans halophyticus]TCP55302.1 hypothetical protein EV191_102514 [Tamaricihabitans halophyticus]
MTDPFAGLARALWVRFETYHAVTYFTPESRAVTDELGCQGGWMGYFGMRAAPLGAVDAATITSAFYGFHPRRVARAVPDAWRVASPARYLAARLSGVDKSLRRLLGAETLASGELAEAADLASSAATVASVAGRPMAAANQALDSPGATHLRPWQACTVLRESRGDGHIAALVVAELPPAQALVLFGAERGIDAEYLREARGWTPDEWTAATSRLVERGLLDQDGAPTTEGQRLRDWIEERTDAAASGPWRELGTRRAERLAELLTPIAREIAEGNEAMARNPMALDARTALAVAG